MIIKTFFKAIDKRFCHHLNSVNIMSKQYSYVTCIIYIRRLSSTFWQESLIFILLIGSIHW